MKNTIYSLVEPGKFVEKPVEIDENLDVVIVKQTKDITKECGRRRF